MLGASGCSKQVSVPHRPYKGQPPGGGAMIYETDTVPHRPYEGQQDRVGRIPSRSRFLVDGPLGAVVASRSRCSGGCRRPFNVDGPLGAVVARPPRPSPCRSRRTFNVDGPLGAVVAASPASHGFRYGRLQCGRPAWGRCRLTGPSSPTRASVLQCGRPAWGRCRLPPEDLCPVAQDLQCGRPAWGRCRHTPPTQHPQVVVPSMWTARLGPLSLEAALLVAGQHLPSMWTARLGPLSLRLTRVFRLVDD
ncbi:hypothetical protein ABH917_000862 [Thermobifida halotolerans]